MVMPIASQMKNLQGKQLADSLHCMCNLLAEAMLVVAAHLGDYDKHSMRAQRQHHEEGEGGHGQQRQRGEEVAGRRVWAWSKLGILQGLKLFLQT